MMVLEVPADVELPCHGMDPSIWFPETETGREASSIEALEPAKEICRVCPLVEECLMVALTNDETHGVWGGLGPDERTVLRKKMKERGWFKSVA